MIYSTNLIIGTNQKVFDERLNGLVDNLQAQRLEVEIQYAGQGRGNIYSALVIARTP